MTRYIDADAVYKILESCEIRKATIGNPLTDWEYGYTCGIERAESEIECAPTIDAVPVIRCKDCKRWNTIFDRNTAEFGLCQSRSQLEATRRDDFCSQAERRTDDLEADKRI